MKVDMAFPNYAARITKFLLAYCIAGAAVLFLFMDWTWSAGWALGALFHILLYKVLEMRYNKWMADGRDATYLGHHLLMYTTSRFFLEILSALAVIFSPFNIFGYLGGLLTLPIASLTERLASLIKK